MISLNLRLSAGACPYPELPSRGDLNSADMRLKRGVERASCDFCHRRKIKCDRSSRESQGHDSCSPCSLRGIQCLLDDSDDVRLRRRRRATVRDVEQSPSLLTTATADAIVQNFNRPSNNAVTLDEEVAPVSSQSLEQPLPSYFPSNIDDSISSSLDQSPDFSFIDTPFELSPESTLFLDQVFLSNSATPLEYLQPQTLTDIDIQSSMDADLATQNSTSESLREASAFSTSQKPWIDCDLDEAAFYSALHAYFDFATVHLPVLIEDAFWQDYRNGRCSLALVYAIACRGISFSSNLEVWNEQQCLALKFREKFLEAQQNSTSKSVMRLDDLEALAIMVNWTYDETQSLSLHSQLGRLFLTHEALVLATLQCQMQDCDEVGQSGPTVPLARSEERRKLLFWHVYGLDAFHNLDQKTMSRIPDGKNSEVSSKLPQIDSGSYLDAILSLAIVAREILQALVTVGTKRNGVECTELMNVYDRLSHWQKHVCPSHLRKKRDADGRLMPLTINESRRTKFLQPLHCSILWLLEINCYMQIEDCVSQYGVQNGAPLEGEMMALRVEFEALRAVHDGVEISRWMRQYSASTTRGDIIQSHSPIDLAPSIARDICAGLCFWTCERGKKVFRQGSSGLTNIRPRNRQHGANPEKDQRKQDVNDYRESAKQFRDAVATATSHRDTEYVLERLDKQIASFEQVVAQ
ncbi:transcriptional regulator family: Fungal Specific TF [Trichoderma aggressivum f. europaeum]|uniref:Transcriptional regulator family: Fungal Specific TF n=1 Tax=Trichoderma aggressivum f. europaeum TaxID=173218 RepID=A0AAE1IG36_9HYPO|nr:transcriptional regulator family: Fungal Specific TF [Trichoderma aggressivum f. europaeum]